MQKNMEKCKKTQKNMEDKHVIVDAITMINYLFNNNYITKYDEDCDTPYIQFISLLAYYLRQNNWTYPITIICRKEFNDKKEYQLDLENPETIRQLKFFEKVYQVKIIVVFSDKGFTSQLKPSLEYNNLYHIYVQILLIYQIQKEKIEMRVYTQFTDYKFIYDKFSNYICKIYLWTTNDAQKPIDSLEYIVPTNNEGTEYLQNCKLELKFQPQFLNDLQQEHESKPIKYYFNSKFVKSLQELLS